MDSQRLKHIAPAALLAAAAVPAAILYRRFQRDSSRAYRRISAAGRLAETAFGPVHYTAFGQGPPILIVHGAGGGCDQGEYFARLIGANHRWIAPSRFGFLGSPVPSAASSATQADAYASLLDALGVDRVRVVGVSMGGPSALLFAQRYPQRTSCLALVSAASHALPPRPPLLAALFNLFLNDFVFWALLRLSPQGLLAALGVPIEVQKRLSAADVRQLHAFLESLMPMAARRKGQLLEQRMSEFDASQIGSITAPTLILHACDDTLVAFEQAEFSARRIPGVQLVPMQMGGHLALMMDFNAGAKQQLQDFLVRCQT